MEIAWQKNNVIISMEHVKLGAIEATKVQNAQKNVMKTFLESTVKSNVTQTVMDVIKRQVYVILGVNLVGKECLAKKNA